MNAKRTTARTWNPGEILQGFLFCMITAAALVLAGVPAVALGSPVTVWVTTADGRGADAQVSENGGSSGATSGGSGTGASMNARSSSDRNEHILLRFDLAEAGISGPGTVTAASLRLTPFRNETSNRSWQLYGLPATAAGQDWDEATIEFSTAPGLIFDGNSTTHGVDTDVWTSLTTGSFPNMTKGSEMTLTSHSSLAAFLNGFLGGGGDPVSFLIRRTTSASGQDRFATKEATALDNDSPTGNAGDFAPRLSFTFYPALHATYYGDGNIGDMGAVGWDSDRLPNLAADVGTIAPGALCRVLSGDKDWPGQLIVRGTLKLQHEPYTYSLNARLQGGELQVGTSGTNYRRYNGPLMLDDVPGNTINVGETSSQFLDLWTNSIITGEGGFTKAGPGQLRMHAANTYSGATHVDAGNVRVYHADAMQNSTVHINVNNGLDLQIDNVVLGGLAGMGALNLKAYTLYAGNNNADTSYDGAISGTGALTKVGDGVLALTGENSYGGATAVSGGSLLVNGTHTGGDYTVTDGGTLGGEGEIHAGVTIGSGGMLAPGQSVGKLNINGDLTFEAGSFFDVDLAKVDGIELADLVAMTGGLYLDENAAIRVSLLDSFSPDVGASFTILSGESHIEGAFHDEVLVGDGFGYQTTFDGWKSFELSYGNSVVLTVVPEPGAWLLLLSALACGVLVRRRR